MQFMDLRIGFWNINKKDVSSYIYDLLASKDLDLLFLSEHQGFINQLLTKSLPNPYEIIEPGPMCKKVMAIKKESLDFSIRTEGRRFITLESPSQKTTITALHLSDNTNDNKSQFARCEELRMILEASYAINNDKEVFVGDFNCMPFADELTNVNGMHAVLFKKEMKTKSGGKRKRYNPMLLHLNEQGEIYGSFRYTSGNCPLYWYAFDQVIVSESLADFIADIEYVKEANGKTLMSPRNVSPSVSDHLPLVFRIWS